MKKKKERKTIKISHSPDLSIHPNLDPRAELGSQEAVEHQRKQDHPRPPGSSPCSCEPSPALPAPALPRLAGGMGGWAYSPQHPGHKSAQYMVALTLTHTFSTTASFSSFSLDNKPGLKGTRESPVSSRQSPGSPWASGLCGASRSPTDSQTPPPAQDKAGGGTKVPSLQPAPRHNPRSSSPHETLALCLPSRALVGHLVEYPRLWEGAVLPTTQRTGWAVPHPLSRNDTTPHLSGTCCGVDAAL